MKKWFTLVLVFLLAGCYLPRGLPPEVTGESSADPGALDPSGNSVESGTGAGATQEQATALVSVSVETNCRSGPDSVYDRLGVLFVGEQAEVVGRYTPGNWWVVRNPDADGDCWLWGMYATVVGDTAALPEMVPPPTPTPLPVTEADSGDAPASVLDFTVIFVGICVDDHDLLWATFRIHNTGSLPLESIYAHIWDSDATLNLYGPGTSDTPFRGTADCNTSNMISSLAPGANDVMRFRVASFIPGNHAALNLNVCSGEGLSGSCQQKIISFSLP